MDSVLTHLYVGWILMVSIGERVNKMEVIRAIKKNITSAGIVGMTCTLIGSIPLGVQGSIYNTRPTVTIGGMALIFMASASIALAVLIARSQGHKNTFQTNDWAWLIGLTSVFLGLSIIGFMWILSIF
jgi:uncharacterized membrane protein YqjE